MHFIFMGFTLHSLDDKKQEWLAWFSYWCSSSILGSPGLYCVQATQKWFLMGHRLPWPLSLRCLVVRILKSDFSSSRWCLMFSQLDGPGGNSQGSVRREWLSKYKKSLLDTSPFLLTASASVSPPNIWPVMLLGYVFPWKQFSFLFSLTLPAPDFWISISIRFLYQFELAAAHPYIHIFTCAGCFFHSSWWRFFISGSKADFHLKLLSSLLCVFFCILRIVILLFLFSFLFLLVFQSVPLDCDQLSEISPLQHSRYTAGFVH